MTLDLEALETSFDLIAPRGDELMDVFYAGVFEAAPAVKPLFARARHVAYGAKPEHYPVVGGVLIASMEEIAGEAWRPEYGRAWCQAFAIVAGAMVEGAESAALEAAA